MLRLIGTESERQARGHVTLRHATPRRNLQSILRRGLLTAKSKGRLKAVWLHTAGRSEWAALHTVQRHGGIVENVVVLELVVPAAWLHPHGGKALGLFRSDRDVPMRMIRRVINFGELSASPVEE